MTTTPTATLSYSKDRKSIDLVGYWPGKRQSTKAEGGLYTAAKKVRKLFRRSIESWNYNYYAQFSITNTYRQWTIFYGKLNIKV